MKKISRVVIILMIAAGVAFAQDKEVKQITLPDVKTELAAGEGRDKVDTLCNICHSVDYITMQPKSSRAQWAAEVTKMRKVFGAPISDADAEVIIDYLAGHYGTGK